MSNVKTTMSLDEVARQIKEHAEKSDEHVLEAAKLVAEARRRVRAGEMDDMTWSKWAEHKIKLSGSRLRELETIADADDPVEALERLRAQTRDRVKKHRAKKAAERSTLESERKQLIAWAKTADLDDVKRVLELVVSNENVAGSSEETSDVESQRAA